MKFGQKRVEEASARWSPPPCPHCAEGSATQLATGCVRCTTLQLRSLARDGKWLEAGQLLGWQRRYHEDTWPTVQARWGEIEQRVLAGGKA